MAVVFTLMSASPCMLKYKVTGGAGESGNLDATGNPTPDMYTDALYGTPMKFMLWNYPITNQAQGRAFAFDRNDIVLSILPRDTDAAWWVEANTDGGTRLRLTLTCVGADATGSYLTIEYKHTLVQ
jgi:hypothetical protein